MRRLKFSNCSFYFETEREYYAAMYIFPKRGQFLLLSSGEYTIINDQLVRILMIMWILIDPKFEPNQG